MYGRETYKKLDRQVPKYMQGIRLAEQRSPAQIRIQAETERALMPHPVLGGATRNDRVWLGLAHPTTFAKASVEAEKKSHGVALLVLAGVVLWIATR